MKTAAIVLATTMLLPWSVRIEQPQTGASIEGAVLVVGTEQPVRAHINLNPDAAPVTPRGGARGVPRPAASTMTDSSGRFALKDVPTGSYRLTITANGFVKQELPIRVVGDQTMKDVVLRMTRTGTVSGRVTDDAGWNSIGAEVQVVSVAWNAQGQKTLVPVSTTRVDDRGEYRLFGLTPGRYYLAAGTLGRPLYQLVYNTYWGGAPGSSLRPPNSNVIEQLYGVMFYPGVADLKDAAPIDVQPGADIPGMDLVVPRQEPHQVRGRVVDARTGQSMTSAFITLAQLNFRDEVVISMPAGGGGLAGSTGEVYDPAKGFELLSVSPGWFIITAEPGEAAGPLPARASKLFPSAFAVYNLTNSDINDVVLTIEDPMSIGGRVVVDGQLPSTVPGLDRMKVGMAPMDGPFERWLGAACSQTTSSTNIRCIPMPRSQPVQANGTFQVQNMKRGRFRVTLDSVPADYYVKEIRFDKNDILNTPLQFAGPVPEPMEVILSAAAGQIAGSVGSPNAQVVLIPDTNRTRIDLFRTATTDASGRFTLRGITPGDYKIYAWEAIEPYAYFDPDFVQRAQSSGRAVRVTESDRLTIDLKLIPLDLNMRFPE